MQYPFYLDTTKSNPKESLPVKKRDFISIDSLTSELIYELFDFSAYIKAIRRSPNPDAPFLPLKNRTVAMIFEKPSLRTRVSFEVGVHELGGYAINLTGDGIGIGKRESVKDVAGLLSRYNDAIVARLYSHDMMEELAHYATIPVINALTDLSHPCQVLADAFTLYEKGLWHDGIKVVFVGDGNNVANSWIELAGLLPIHFVLTCPKGYEPDEQIFEKAKASGISKIEIINDPKEAVAEADVLYSDVWTSMGQEAEKQKRLNDFQPYQLNAELLSHAKSSAVVMHCMPAKRGEEITNDVIDGEQSIILDEAENRLHLQKALMVKLLNRELYKDFGLTHRLQNAAQKYESQKR
ncbi:ornithine carbamoyltransferase [Chloroherpeton thalassium ATCC 35110]|uniref:Ornithine carbamoyltransferase n=1 Tax=Chloroherpeton thalassium (strain ATCC 35110 / GB-78) TaxID=517418 RepID=B3QWH1_CHLT3|nr:ornithine carbamoyltransferase [Chloroherpeton thalassium]ACF14731.1 ornithine carbamoyltransferase [Chloroherpeton thalassium ATCC 35110]